MCCANDTVCRIGGGFRPLFLTFEIRLSNLPTIPNGYASKMALSLKIAGFLIFGVFGLAGLAGCAGSGVGPKTSATTALLPLEAKEVVAGLAASRWEALIQGDIAKAYGYLSPGTRSVMSLDLYKAKTKSGMWKKASVDTVVCEQDRCEVAMVIIYSYRNMKSIETRLSEVWLREGEGWWFSPEK